jgi:hypothetical protein
MKQDPLDNYKKVILEKLIGLERDTSGKRVYFQDEILKFQSVPECLESMITHELVSGVTPSGARQVGPGYNWLTKDLTAWVPVFYDESLETESTLVLVHDSSTQRVDVFYVNYSAPENYYPKTFFYLR